jgi:ubiquitin C-terminal hydrolase
VAKIKTFVEYPEVLKVQKVESETEELGVFSKENYYLVYVVSHHGSNVTSGHYTACILRNGQWFNVHDSEVSKISTLVELNQEAYILMLDTLDPVSLPLHA